MSVPLRTRLERLVDRIPHTVLVIAFGQFLSLLLCTTGITSELLANHGISLPATQNLGNYVILLLVFGTPLLRKGDLWNSLRERGLRYLVICLFDVGANYAVVRAYQYTTLTSVQLLDCFSIPTVMLLSVRVFKTVYNRYHVLSVGLCLVGMGVLVYSDIATHPRDENDESEFLF
jgi:solute carrier family 35 protein F1/2